MDTPFRLLAPPKTSSPTVTAAERLAAVLEAIDAIAGRMSWLEAPHRSTAAHARGARTVSRQFITAMVAAVEVSPELRKLGTFDTDAAVAVLQLVDAFRPVTQRLAMLLAAINYTTESRRAKVVADALKTHAIAKGLARDSEETALVGHLRNLRRSLRRRNRSGKPNET